MAILQPDIIEILIPGYRSADAAVTFWDINKDNYTLNAKVAYFSEIYNAEVVPVPVGTPPTDTNYWRQITSIGGGGGSLPTGGIVEDVLIKDSPVDADASWRRGSVSHWNATITDYLTDQIVAYGSSLYISTTDNPPAGTLPTDEAFWRDLLGAEVNVGAVTFWDEDKTDYALNDKVSYLDSIFNVVLSPIPVGTLPTDTNYWKDIGVPFSPVITLPETTGQVIQYDEITGEWVNDILDGGFVEYTYPIRPPYEEHADSVNNIIFKLTQGDGETFKLVNVDANLYEPSGNSILHYIEQEYTEVGTLTSVDEGNINGSFHIEFTPTAGTSLSENDAVFITNTPPVDGTDPDNNSDTFVIDKVLSSGEVIVNKPVLKFPNGFPDGIKMYKWEFETNETKDDTYVEFTGQGLVGYPFPKRVVQPGDICRASKPFNTTFWTYDRSRDRPNFYGVDIDEDTRKRPVDVFRKDPSSDNGILNNLFTFIYEGIRQNVPPLGASSPIALQNFPVQNVHIVSNQVNYDLSDYPNSYVIRNHNGNTYDFVVIYGEVGDNPSFGNDHPEMMDVAHVIMNDVGVIQSVQDSFWMNDNGGVEVKETTNPDIIIGGEVVDNGLAGEFQKRRYTLTESTIVTSYKESIESVYPDDLSITEIWPDNDDRGFSSFTRDGRWYDASATIPDPQEPNANHALIPFGSFSVDFLYVYQKQGSALDYLIVKGDTLYTASDLVQGVEIKPLRSSTTLNGYVPTAALLQYGSGDLGYHNIIDIKNKESGDLVSITTEEFLQDLSSKTQFRTEQNLLSKIIYNSALQLGDPQLQGWAVTSSGSNIITPVPDPDDGATTLNVETNSSTSNHFNRVFLRSNIEDFYTNGGSLSLRVKPEVGSTSGETRIRMVSLDDPRATETFFYFPEPNPQVSLTPYAVHDSESPPLTITSTGEFSFIPEKINVESNGTLLSGLNNKFSIRQFNGSVFDFFVNGSQISSGPNWQFNGLENGKTVTIRRSGVQVQLLVEGVLRATATAPDADDWVLSTIGARDDGGGVTYSDQLRGMGLRYLQIKETSVSTPRIYQMATRLSVFEPDIPADGDFNIVDYAAFFWKARVSGDYPVWDDTKADYLTGDIVHFAGNNFECILDNPPTGSLPSSEPTYWENVSDISGQSLYLRWGTNGTDTTVTLVRDAGNIQYTFLGETGYFDIDIAVRETSLNGWGNLDFTTVPPSGGEQGQTTENIEWNYSGFTDFSDHSDLLTANHINGFGNPRQFYMRNYTLGLFRTGSTIFLTAEDLALGNIFVAEGNRDWTWVMPPYSTAIDDLNSPNASSVTLKFIGEGSYLIKRPDLSNDVLVNNREFIQGVFTDTAFVDITTEDDFTTLNYVNYTVSDITSGAGGIVAPSPPTEAVNVSYDPTGTPLTSTNVQSAVTELALRGGTVSERITVTSNAGDVINLTELTIPVDYLTDDFIEFTLNGVGLDKGVEIVRNSSTSFRLPLNNTITAEDIIKYFNYPS